MVSRALDPLAASQYVSETYARYVKTLVDVRDPALRSAFTSAVDRAGLLTKGPFLEATPAYQAGRSVRELVEAGMLHHDLISLDSPALPIDRPLYLHQEEAIRKLVAGRNAVVTTGTGSGKTEAFLIPIINHLIAERAAGTLHGGVRALVLYPMNALANDQVKRLRALLAAHPQLTFGRYTGETKERPSDALRLHQALHPGADILPNELLSREAMRDSPPHILLTNYAMLEYLLLRPADLTLFAGNTWQFVALDEAHVYDSAKGAEIAMLLRRLKDRVAAGRDLQCVATSASVQGTPSQIVNFAEKLFDAPFEWVLGDSERQDLVSAVRVTSPEKATWGPLSPSDWAELAPTVDDSTVLGKAKLEGATLSTAAAALEHEQTVVELKRRLSSGPRTVRELADTLFVGHPDRELALSDLVTVTSATRDTYGNPVLAARYHHFVRATEGAFTCLSPDGPQVQLARHEKCPTCESACFEFGACQRCGAVYLAGTVDKREGRLFFVPSARGDSALTWLMLGEDDAVSDEDEEALDASIQSVSPQPPALLCVVCGALHEGGAARCDAPGCGATTLRLVRRLERAHRVMSSCVRCGARARDVVRRLRTGSDAPPSVLTTALYQQLPAGEKGAAELPGQGRKLLMFSDSRQAAAFAAPYLQNTYGSIQQRSLLARGLLRACDAASDVGVSDLVHYALEEADAAGFFEAHRTQDTNRREVAKWVALELVAIDRRQSLQGLGLLSVRHHNLRAVAPPPVLLSAGLTEDEAWALIEELVALMRQQGALSMPSGVSHKDEAFEPRLGPIYMRQTGSDTKRKVLSWSPTQGTNRRIDYLTRVLRNLGIPLEPRSTLDGMWGFLREHLGWLRRESVSSLGEVYQDDVELLRFMGGPEIAFARCTRCRAVTSRNIRNVCPTLRCDGELRTERLPAVDADDQHYRRLYRTLEPIALRAQEHTAQWEPARAAEIQNDFVAGRTNVLSSSTTFELGVDVGDLQSVVLRNMPPRTANYVQRAGRAGRRTASAALVLTYAQRRSHDLARYQNPERMIAGQMRVPIVPLENERIDRRHAHSVALSAFFREQSAQYGERYKTVADFFLPATGKSGTASDAVTDFLKPVPDNIRSSLRAVLPAGVSTALGVESDGWVSSLISLLASVQLEVTSDVGHFEEEKQRAKSADKFFLADQINRTIDTIRGRELLGFLGARNVLPKYGFPVDTVELRTIHSADPAGRQLELSRDLAQAIYDYAPGNQVIAGGKRWTSIGVHRVPGKDLVDMSYQVCAACGSYVEGVEAGSDACGSCATARRSAAKTYVIPEFGFNCDPSPDNVGTSPPDRRWGGATHIQSIGAEIATQKWVAPTGASCTGRAGVRGRITMISDANGLQFAICDWCGYTTVLAGKLRWVKHKRPLTGKECSGPYARRSLGHRFETDIVEFTCDAWDSSSDENDWFSLLYALIQGASESLEISEDDLDGALYRTGNGRRAVVMFDTVPGGAGVTRLVADDFDRVLAGAMARVDLCECGEETSCYACLRSYRNASHHDALSRAAAIRMLQPLVGAVDADGAPPHASAVEAVAPLEVELVNVLASRGFAPGIAGYENSDGVPWTLAWPDLQVAVDLSEEADVNEVGWRVVRGSEPELLADAVKAALDMSVDL